MGQVSPKNPTPNSPLGRELESAVVLYMMTLIPPGGGGVSQGDGTLKSPKGYLLWVKISITYNVLAPASPALVLIMG